MRAKKAFAFRAWRKPEISRLCVCDYPKPIVNRNDKQDIAVETIKPWSHNLIWPFSCVLNKWRRLSLWLKGGVYDFRRELGAKTCASSVPVAISIDWNKSRMGWDVCSSKERITRGKWLLEQWVKWVKLLEVTFDPECKTFMLSVLMPFVVFTHEDQSWTRKGEITLFSFSVKPMTS